jgi:hypothetical protein
MARRGKRLTRKLKKTARKTRRAKRGGVDPKSPELLAALNEAKRELKKAQDEADEIDRTGTNEQVRAARKKVTAAHEKVRNAESRAYPKPDGYSPSVHGTRY